MVRERRSEEVRLYPGDSGTREYRELHIQRKSHPEAVQVGKQLLAELMSQRGAINKLLSRT